ncbi:MAG: TonB family protein [Opitutae bacterium]|nr:TonB family protein [Opitutae bacterium]
MNSSPLSGALRVAIVLGLLAAPALRATDPIPPSALVVDGPALLQEWSPPAYPEAARQAKKEGRVEVDLIVDEHGAVTDAQVADATDPVFAPPALEAVRRWKFKPALDDGKPVASGMTAPVVFSLASPKLKPPYGLPPQTQWPAPAKRKAPRVANAVDPDYPEELDPRKLPGEVQLELGIGVDGRVASRRVLWASHGAFVAEALRVAERWTFEPARQGLLARPATMRAPVSFVSVGARRPEICAANGLRLADESEVDVWPEPVVMQEPVYPRERLVAGEEGSAEATFVISPRGGVTEFALGECSAPEFGAALAAAVDAWYFRPGLKGGNNVPVRVALRHEFRRTEGGALLRLAAALAENKIGSARGLDAPLEVVWRGFPAYPEALRATKPTGEAEVEFVIDRDGRARAPRVVSATLPEFGWAAATAVNQWVFAPPRRGGEPTDVLVRVPLRFNATE